MLYKIETSVGGISINKNVIGRIVIQAVNNLKGSAKISNHRGRVAGLVKTMGGGDGVLNDIDISMSENGLDIRLYIVINFGTSIGNITNSLIDEIYEKTEEAVSIKPNSIAVIVTGIITKNQIMRRNIEVKR